MQPDSASPWVWPWTPPSSLLSALLSLQHEMDIRLHSAFMYVLYTISRESRFMGPPLRNGTQNPKDVFLVLLPWRQFWDAFLKAPWKVPKGTGTLERDGAIVWVDSSWLHCTEFYNKDMSSGRNLLVFKQRSERLKWGPYDMKADCLRSQIVSDTTEQDCPVIRVPVFLS